MLVSKALLGTTCFNLLSRVILADDVCRSDCPDPFPPGHQSIGDAWWAIGNEASGAYITDITTTLEVPPKPDGVKGLRLINSALDNSNVSDVTDTNAAKEEFQILLAAFPDPPFGGCEATGDQWCLFTSYYSEKNGQSLVQFPMTTVNPGDAIHTYNLDVGVQVTYHDLSLGPNVTER
ncbi:MAG: hypothetical protein LQ349_008625 [Xanthoria aureola]|nr:MAG: hypothetical protein LQ349_008625 [Xanthoria aureola]